MPAFAERPFRFLVAESEPPEDREKRRESVGKSSGETYIETLRAMAPGAACDRVKPADAEANWPDPAGLGGYDAVFITGSPLHVYQDSPEARREIEFMRAVFASGAPSFGSCAGLQVAVAAAGGKVGPGRRGREAGFARRITPTEQGRAHPLLDGRPWAYDAPSVHSDAAETLPEGGLLLACNGNTEIQAVELRHDQGVFWGVQYHPELSLHEVAAALRRQADDLIEDGLCLDREEVEAHADLIDALDQNPERRDIAWRLGLDEQVIDPELRQTELRNFIERLVKLTRSQRGRG